MELKKNQWLAVIAVFISISLAVLIITVGIVAKSRAQNSESWVLHSYGNNVALYNGSRVIEVYGSIVLDTLPADDKRQLDAGIAFTTREEAVNAIEDYDG